MREWISGLFQSTLSRLLAYALSGFFTAFVVMLFGGRLGEFLTSEIQVSIGLVLLLSSFSLIGLAAGVERLFDYIGERSSRPSLVDDERLEEAQKQLLKTLAVVESQPPLNTQGEAELRAELLSRLDQWDITAAPYLGQEEQHRIQTMRDHIQNQSLKYAREEGADWTKIVKDITSIAQSGD